MDGCDEEWLAVTLVVVVVVVVLVGVGGGTAATEVAVSLFDDGIVVVDDGGIDIGGPKLDWLVGRFGLCVAVDVLLI